LKTGRPLGAPARAEIRRKRLCPFEPDLGNASVGKWVFVFHRETVADPDGTGVYPFPEAGWRYPCGNVQPLPAEAAFLVAECAATGEVVRSAAARRAGGAPGAFHTFVHGRFFYAIDQAV